MPILHASSLGLVLFFLVALAPSPARADILSEPIINPANGHFYYLLTQNIWTASEAEAVSLGGHLATINDAAEDAWVYAQFSTFQGISRHLWIGLYDSDPVNSSLDRNTRRTEYVWVSGEPVGYTNWADFEPNNPFLTDEQKLDEHFVHIWYPLDLFASQWNDFVDDATLFGAPLNGVVEVIPASVEIPSSLALCILGLGLLCATSLAPSGFARRARGRTAIRC